MKNENLDRSAPTPEKQKVTPEGKSVVPFIDGVILRPLITHSDERGELTELYRESWGVHPDPLVYVKHITVRPGKIKGWAKHQYQDDRYAVLYGTMQVVLYDDRPDSPTHGLINEFFLGTINRSLLLIPRMVYHADRNVGTTDAIFINMPNKLYDHVKPDKLRLPLDNDLIPYTWR